MTLLRFLLLSCAGASAALIISPHVRAHVHRRSAGRAPATAAVASMAKPTAVDTAVFSPSALDDVQLDGFESDGCVLPAWAVEEHPIALSVRLQPPLGLLLGELREGGVTLNGFVDGLASAAAREVLRIGDRLVRIEHTPVRRASVEQISALVSARSRDGKDIVLLTFERDCGVETVDECPVPTEAVETLESMLAPGGASTSDRSPAATGTAASPIVVAAGAASIIGGRSTQEDTTILTTLEVTPRGSASSTRFTLAGVFDGHRGPRASAHAAATLPAAVKEALSRGEPSPLAVAWRATCESYRRTGHQDGSTATVVLASDDGRCQFLNVGDSRALLAAHATPGAPCTVAFATKDHSTSDEAEIERIREGGGIVACGRGGVMRVAVDCPEGNWLVAVPRALGGSQWADAGICDTADVTSLRLDSRHAFILLGSDGVWGPFDGVGGASEGAERVACLVAEARATARSPAPSAGDVAEMVVARAEGSGGTDNASCVILYLA
jgi:serine/threonine protein phosphatase PrpC